ncbi:MAG TPA: hypothetical protein VK391_06785, partial [Allosphingosinicella sp.]|nr:hypothetical protein [Allosphingosinicella sp.]
MRMLHASCSALAVATFALAGCAGTTTERAPAPAMQQGALQITTQLPRNVRPLQYTIAVQPDAPNLRFSARTLADIEVLEPTDSITLNAVDLDFTGVS